MHPTQEADLKKYIGQLRKSRKGLSAIRYVLAWLDDDGLALDYANQDAIMGLIALAWQQPGSTGDAMREVIGGN